MKGCEVPLLISDISPGLGVSICDRRLDTRAGREGEEGEGLERERQKKESRERERDEERQSGPLIPLSGPVTAPPHRFPTLLLQTESTAITGTCLPLKHGAS